MKHNKNMIIAAREAEKGMKKGDGGPFGAVVTKDGKIIARAHNMVLRNKDPSAHAEITAIRKAGKKLGKYHLDGCEIYSSCEPCPMCLACIHWSRIKKVHYGCTEKDAEEIGFDDKLINDIFNGKRESIINMEQIDRDICLKPFNEFKDKKDKKIY